EQLRQAMYQDHPYGLSILGTEAAIAKLLRSDLEDYHQTYFRPDNLVISVAGRVTPAEAIEQITSVFWDWQAPQTPVNQPVLPLIKSQPSRVITPQETQQSIVMLGYLASAVKDPNYAALKLLNTYLGNGLSSRLFVELREKRGLAYDVSAFYPTRQSASTFVVYMGTAPENTTIALEGLRAEVERLCTSSLSIDELQTSTNKLLGQYALGKQTNAQLAQIYGWYETLGLGIEFDTQFQEDVTNVTPEIAQAVANQYFSEPYISLVGPNEAINF
ncbi:MAG TPA: peptidase M16, partial [Cyanobacteria bacterium UBA12227]|nr:peptidase M16 [Cyanobacteria bacterium UBA12227]